MCVGRYAEKTQWSEAKWNLFEPLARSNLFGQMPAIDLSVLCIPAECDNIKLPIECEIASRWDAYLLCDICRHFASVMLHFASLISHNLRCIPAYTHQIPMGFFTITIMITWKTCISLPKQNCIITQGHAFGMFRCKQPFTPTHYQQRNYRLNSLTSKKQHEA